MLVFYFNLSCLVFLSLIRSFHRLELGLSVRPCLKLTEASQSQLLLAVVLLVYFLLELLDSFLFLVVGVVEGAWGALRQRNIRV